MVSQTLSCSTLTIEALVGGAEAMMWKMGTSITLMAGAGGGAAVHGRVMSLFLASLLSSKWVQMGEAELVVHARTKTQGWLGGAIGLVFVEEDHTSEGASSKKRRGGYMQRGGP
ncbi:hypothetical protein BT96DRAFT_950563 [Gymnopus androsaceus JB14]|uniref:Uncharacterized protein n=1 Tax=Gymnopus androsaceus JB14 TaxID=1447944 RepID=A0A6A4GG59_9AGAR|nr:hypothetical protein BT96DRAFT_950563 [Gymnopus androsaceus JB14]